MLGSFKQAFGKKEAESRDLPDEVIEILNKNLPNNFGYVKDEKGNYRGELKGDSAGSGFKVTTRLHLDEEKDKSHIDKLKKLPKDKWLEYWYRIQQTIPFSDAQAGNDDKMVPIEVLSEDPISGEKVSFIEGWIYPPKFPEPVKLKLESPEGDSVMIGIQQQAYDSITEIKFKSIDYPALQIEFLLYSPLVETVDDNAKTNIEYPAMASFTIKPKLARTVKEAIEALHIFRGLYYGKTKIGGVALESGFNKPINIQIVEENITFWETALQLERALGVTFLPSAEYPVEDRSFFTELEACLLHGRSVVINHPFEKFTIYDTSEEGMKAFQNRIGKGAVRYEFLEGPLSATLLGSEFTLYSQTVMDGFVITSVEKNPENKEAIDVYISDPLERVWTLSKHYITEEEANNICSDEKTCL